MPQYRAYGLMLAANTEIPGLVAMPAEQSSPVDVSISMGFLPQDLAVKQKEEWYVSRLQRNQNQPNLRAWQVDRGNYFWLQYREGTEFIVERQGGKIWATWQAPLTLEDTATYLLGPVLGFVLRLRGTVCLHASAVAISGQVAVFVGRAGAGKSTTAAAFARLGYPVLSDDVAALRESDGDRIEVQPAYPRLRLWPQSVLALYGSADYLPRLVPTHPTWDKRYLDLAAGDYQFQSDPLPLRRIYLLKPRRAHAAPQIETISMQAGMMALVANTYTNYLLDKTMRAKEFRALSQLVASISVRQLHPHADSTRLSQLVKIVLSDFDT